MSAAPRKPTRLLGGHPTHVRTLGSGPKTALALHCSLAHGGAWAAMAGALEDKLRLIAPDLPSHGHSAPVDRAEEFHNISTAMAKALAAELGGGAPIDVIGHSFGASVALRLALEAPGLVASLTLFEPVFFAAARPAMGPGTRRWFERQSEVDALVAAGELIEAARLFNADWGQGQDLDALPPHLKETMVSRIHLISATNGALWEDEAGLLAPGRLEALDLPVLLAEGAQSPGIIAEVNAALTTRLPKVRRLMQAGAGHMLPLTHALALAPEVLAHLNS